VIDTNKVPQVPPVSDFGMNFADFLATFHPDSTDRLSTGKQKPPDPRPHQIEAIKDVIAGFQTYSRGQLIMPCATDPRCNFIVAPTQVGSSMSYVARQGEEKLNIVYSPVLGSPSSAQVILFIHTPPSLNADDQETLFSKYADLTGEYQSLSRNPSNLTTFQRQAKLKELNDQITQMELSPDTVVHNWVCENVTDVNQTYIQSLAQVLCSHEGKGVVIVLSANDPILGQISRGSSITFDGYVVQPWSGGHEFGFDMFPAIILTQKITIH
jgi:hypothetical protein